MKILTRTGRVLPLLVVLVIGVAGGVYILRSDVQSVRNDAHQHKAGDDHGHTEDHSGHDEEAAKGPHGGRMLADGDFAVEVTIFERGVPPQFRVYASDSGKPVPPEQINLSMKLHRLGGRVDEFSFAKDADYLKGDKTVEEPHSFDVEVEAKHAGKSHRWEYSTYEGRVTLTTQMVKEAGIEIQTAGPATIKSSLGLPGQIALNTNRLAHVVPRLAGVTTSVNKNLGDHVKAGEVLASIESREFAEATSEYVEAVHKHEYAQLAFVRTVELWKQKITPDQEYHTTRHALEESEIAKQVAAQKLLSLGLSREDLELLAKEPGGEVVPFKVRSPLPVGLLTRFDIKAPIDGQIIEKHITLGEAVKADADVFMIADLSSVWVEIMVYADDVSRVSAGQSVIIRSKSVGREATGRIWYVSPIVGEETRSAKAIVDLPNSDGVWRPGLFVSAETLGNETNVPIAVSVDAIQTLRDWSVVFVNYGDIFEARPLELGRRDSQWVEVLSGLSPGERYAAKNSFILKADVGKSGATHDH
ncbi:MAG TPA: efflux RND transporter periplasmic adaptor subunit [Phycisphaerae bacterium]|nr:efflux RND transporter periplasmic adaptor subunit [Phycisphaerae bacterium]